MHHYNVINTEKSSLISLQAELIKKKEEVKTQSSGGDRKLTKLGLKTDVNEPLKPVSSKKTKEVEEVEVEDSVLEFSRKALAAKSQLYDKLRKKELITDDSEKFLVNFDARTPYQTTEDVEEPYESDHNSDPENDWVEYVDALGRTRTCLRKDLSHYKRLNEDLVEDDRPPDKPPPEMKSDMPEEMKIWYQKRDELRQKWEEEEKILSHKRDIHYEDVLFDEARTHGVGYFRFSRDETERLKQQEALKKMREETLKNQQHVSSIKERRERQMKQRLEAAKRRKRERLGLPPDADLGDEPALEEIKEEKEKSPEESEEMSKKVEEYLAKVKRSAHIRPWDAGKAVIQPPVMSQEQWVRKQRYKREKEFAPPSSYKAEPVSESEQSGLYFTSKKPKRDNKEEKQTPIKFEYSVDEEKPSSPPRKQGAEIPPPSSYDKATIKPKKSNIAESIEAGLNFLRNEAEKKATKKRACFKE